MTLKQKAIWFVVIPIGATIVWFALAILFLWIDDRSFAGVPECDPQTFVRTKANEYECTGDFGFISAIPLMFGVFTFGIAVLGVLIFIGSFVWHRVKK